MKKKKIVLIDGMSGIGKSTLSQQIYFCKRNNGLNVEWFHEEETNHPIYSELLDSYLDKQDPEGYTDSIINNWKNLLNENVNDELILESQISLVFAANMLWNNINVDDIFDSIIKFLDQIKKYHIELIWLKSKNPREIIEHSIECRGQKWGDWYYEYFNNSKYAESRKVDNITGLSLFWNEVDELVLRAMKFTNINILSYDVLNFDYITRNKQVLKDLSLKSDDLDIELDFKKLQKYYGNFTNPDNSISCMIHSNGTQLLCNLKWPNLVLIQKSNKMEFNIRSFPHELLFVDVDTIKIIGKDIGGLKGSVLRRI